MDTSYVAALFTITTATTLASYAFTKSIRRSIEHAFGNSVRNILRTENVSDQIILNALALARQTRVRFEIGFISSVCFANWIAFFVGGYTRAYPYNGSPYIIEYCDSVIIITFLISFLTAVVLFFNQRNTHSNFQP